MKERKRKITTITIIGIMLFSCVATLSYALWERLFTQSDENRITTLDCFDVTYTEGDKKGTTMQNAIPLTEEEGQQTEAYKVTIKNTCDTTAKYNVILNKKEGSTLNNKNIRTSVDRKTSMLLSEATQIEKKTISGYSVNSSYIIGTGYALPKKEKTINIRSWLDYETKEEGQGKNFYYKITIETGATNEEPTTLGDVILLNNQVHEDKPDFSEGFPNSSTSEEDIKSKSGIYVAEDDDGDTYYFRGKVDNNYVKLSQSSNLLWRVIRINGDGTIRLILNDKIDPAEQTFNEYYNDYRYLGYTYNNTTPCTKDKPCTSNYTGSGFSNSNGGQNSDIKKTLEDWYNTNLKDYDDKIALTTFCNDTSYGSGTEDTVSSQLSLHYGADKRISNEQPSLHCPNPVKQGGENRDYGGVYRLKIGLINIDELYFGGYIEYNIDDNNKFATNHNYLYHDYIWWTMSPYGYGGGCWAIFRGEDNGSIGAEMHNAGYAALPVINLNSDVTVTGSGTEEDPYVVQ